MDFGLEQLFWLAAPILLAAPAAKSRRANRPYARPKARVSSKKASRPNKPAAHKARRPAPSRKPRPVTPRNTPKKAPSRAQPATRHPEHGKPPSRGSANSAHGRKALPVRPAPRPPAKATKPTVPVVPVKPVQPVGRPILLTPEQGKYADSVNPKFRWLSVGGATRYEVSWSSDASMTDTHSVISIATEASVPVEKPLRVGLTYFWRVRGGNEAGWGPWSNVGSFNVLEEPQQP